MVREIRFKTKEDILESYNDDLEKEIEELRDRLRMKEEVIMLLRRENVLLMQRRHENNTILPLSSEQFLQYLREYYNTDETSKSRTGNPLKFRKFASYFLKFYYKLSQKEISEILHVDHTTAGEHANNIRDHRNMDMHMEKELHIHRQKIQA